MSKLDVFKIKQIRRELLTNLNLLYPQSHRLDTIYRTVCGYDPAYSKSLFIKDISYFHDKEYVTFIDDILGGADEFMDKFCKLTAKGKEIAERTMTDPALEI